MRINQLICHQAPVKADKHLSPVLSRVFDYPNSAVIFKNIFKASLIE